MEQVVELLIDVALVTMILVLAAFGLAIIFGMVGVVNLGHGAMLTLGAYFTWQGTTWGLPFVRTSVDHGVAYDAARAGKAEADGMHAAVALAIALTGGEHGSAA